MALYLLGWVVSVSWGMVWYGLFMGVERVRVRVGESWVEAGGGRGRGYTSIL